MKTAISVPDDLFERAEAFARRTGTSRSQLYRHALAEYLARRDASQVTDELNAALEEIAPADDRWRRRAARRAFEHVEW